MTEGPRVVLLLSSPRVAPGLLSVAAWDAVRRSRVLCADPLHHQMVALRSAGVDVEVVDGPATAVAVRLLDVATAEGEVVWLAGPDGDPDVGEALAMRAMESAVVEIEALPGAWDVPGARLIDVVAVMDRLRSPGGCPWDAEQTHASLAPYLIEEAYETLQAIEDGDSEHLREELGDLLLQVAFHARLAEEGEEPWSVDDVAGDLVDKLVRRHPHVFASTVVEGAAEVEANWDAIKQAEKGRVSVTEGIPLGMPALALAAKLARRAGKRGLPSDLLAGQAGDRAGALLDVVLAAVAAGADPEDELRALCRELVRRISAAEAAVAGADVTPDEWRAAWRLGSSQE